ncbi:MAG: DNA recombination-mediator protein A [Firmicutes bacterium ADurb.Bin248]|nr:MAG: DNA recombination-mediator protein A [Firmicutes bacterium ADurb.Bin248]HOF99759.1 SLOG family protein [Clostridia bacterium]HPK14699.1 SLOG family protein [Clostridia bacterium]
MEPAATACFTGYRPQKLPWGGNEDDPRCDALKFRLVESIVAAYARGYRTFLSGMAQGVDTYAAEAVLALSKVLRGMELVCAVPYPAYALSLPREHRARYEAIVLGAARCAVCSEKSGSAAMQRRNGFMVENSSLVIAVYDGKAGGTRNTVALAKETGRDVWLVSPE